VSSFPEGGTRKCLDGAAVRASTASRGVTALDKALPGGVAEKGDSPRYYTT